MRVHVCVYTLQAHLCLTHMGRSEDKSQESQLSSFLWDPQEMNLDHLMCTVSAFIHQVILLASVLWLRELHHSYDRALRMGKEENIELLIFMVV